MAVEELADIEGQPWDDITDIKTLKGMLFQHSFQLHEYARQAEWFQRDCEKLKAENEELKRQLAEVAGR